jgi:hypothetical protein
MYLAVSVALWFIFRTKWPSFTKFCMDVVPLEAIPTCTFGFRTIGYSNMAAEWSRHVEAILAPLDIVLKLIMDFGKICSHVKVLFVARIVTKCCCGFDSARNLFRDLMRERQASRELHWILFFANEFA